MSRVKTVIITRPLKDGKQTAASVKTCGYATLIEPMLTIKKTGSKTRLAQVLKKKPQALLATSKHAVAVFAQMNKGRDIPLIAVGESTAARAEAHGFTNVSTASGTSRALITHIKKHCDPKRGPLLYIRGKEVSTDIAASLASRFTVDEVVLYQAVAAKSFSKILRQKLKEGSVDMILFFSARTAETYAGLVRQYGLQNAHRNVTVLCISKAVANMTQILPWKQIKIARQSNEKSLLGLL